MEYFEKHESYGMIDKYRSQGTSRRLFGSDVKHSNTICIDINQGEVDRSLNREWYCSKNRIITIELSPVQFAEAISNMNTSGIPCTIRNLNGKGLEHCPEIKNKKEIFRNEFEEDLKILSHRIQNSIDVVNDSLQEKKTLNKSDKEKILTALMKIQQDLTSNMPYMSECFDEQIDKIVSHSKAEIEAYVQNKILTLGLEKLEELKLGNNVIQLED